MDVMQQSEIDALLNSASSGGDDNSNIADSGSGAIGGAGAISLPEEYRVSATDSQLQRIRPIRVPVRIRLADRYMRLDNLLDLTVGTIIEFSKSADSELDLMVNNVVIGHGNAVKCGERFGLRVIRIEPWTQRILSEGLLR